MTGDQIFFFLMVIAGFAIVTIGDVISYHNSKKHPPISQNKEELSEQEMDHIQHDLMVKCSEIIQWAMKVGDWSAFKSDEKNVEISYMSLLGLNIKKRIWASSHRVYITYRVSVNGGHEMNMGQYGGISSSNEGPCDVFFHDLINDCPDLLAAKVVWEEEQEKIKAAQERQAEEDAELALEEKKRKHEKTLEALNTLSYYRSNI